MYYESVIHLFIVNIILFTYIHTFRVTTECLCVIKIHAIKNV